jgi:hypothetical protein
MTYITTAITQSVDDASVKQANTLYVDTQIGWLGYTDRILITPYMFMPDDDGTDDGIIFKDTSPHGVGIVDNSAEIYATVPIPKGYKVTHYRIYGNASAQNSALTLYQYSCFTGLVTSKASGDTVSDDEINCTDFTGNTTDGTMALVYVLVTDTADTIFGGYLKIAKV